MGNISGQCSTQKSFQCPACSCQQYSVQSAANGSYVESEGKKFGFLRGATFPSASADSGSCFCVVDSSHSLYREKSWPSQAQQTFSLSLVSREVAQSVLTHLATTSTSEASTLFTLFAARRKVLSIIFCLLLQLNHTAVCKVSGNTLKTLCHN